MIDQIYKEFEDSQISLSESGTETVSGWVYPGRRENPYVLSEFGLNPFGRPETQTRRGRSVSRFFYKVYDHTAGIRNADAAKYPQFTVTYGNAEGKGSAGNLPTKSIYNQYTKSVLPEGESSFGFSEQHFYAINIHRRVMRKRIVSGEWHLSLNFSDSVENGPELKLIDEIAKGKSPEDEYQLRIFSETDDTVYGYFYPGKGIMILNPEKLVDESQTPKNIDPDLRSPDRILKDPVNYQYTGEWIGGFGGNEEQARDRFPDFPYVRNHRKIFDAIKWGSEFKIKSKKQSIKRVYEVVLKEEEFNFSLNPTYADDTGQVTYPGDGSYFTGIGLYNDNYQLLAVAKLEEPMKKTSTKEIEIDVDLEF